MTRAAAILLAWLYGLTPLLGDSLTTTQHSTLKGSISFPGKGTVRIKTSTEQHDFALSEIASFNISHSNTNNASDDSTLSLLGKQITNRFVSIPSAGVITWDGSFISGTVSQIDGSEVHLESPRPQIQLTRINTTAIFLQPLSHGHVSRLHQASPGVMLVNGDLVEGKVGQLQEGEVAVTSLLLGQRRYPVKDVVAILLRQPTSRSAPYHVLLKDGSHLFIPALHPIEQSLSLNHSPFHRYKVPLKEITMFAAHPQTNILDFAWARLQAVPDKEREELLQRMAIPDLVKEAAEANLVRARNIWDDTKRVWGNKTREFTQAKSRHANARKQLVNKQKQLTNAQQQLERTTKDLQLKKSLLVEAERRHGLAQIQWKAIKGDKRTKDNAARKVSDELKKVNNAERNVSRVTNLLKRARERYDKAQELLASAQKVTDEWRLAEEKTKEAHDKALKETNEARQAFDHAMAKLL